MPLSGTWEFQTVFKFVNLLLKLLDIRFHLPQDEVVVPPKVTIYCLHALNFHLQVPFAKGVQNL